MSTAPRQDLLDLVHRWASRLGYYDGKIDLGVDDLEAFTTPEAALTAHAPLWGTKEGAEEAVPVREVRRRLARMLRWFRVARHDMHVAQHPDELRLCLYFVVRGRFFLLPFTMVNVSLAFEVRAVQTPEGLRIDSIHEWPASSADEARQLLVERCSWPDTTAFVPHVAYGAVS